MVKYTSRPSSALTGDMSVDEKVVGYVSALYSIGEELGMDSEFTRVETYDSDCSMEYFAATALGYDSLDEPVISQVRMEMELEEGEIIAEYGDTSRLFKVEVPGPQTEFFEEELGEEFHMAFDDWLRTAASSKFESLRSRKNQILP